MEWYKTTIEFICCRCRKLVKPGKKLGLHLGKVYCYQCGHNLELVPGRRYDSAVIRHLRSICK
ncbi:hypothetical protein ACFLXT_04310 [Chloroflexota bacterium]